MSVYGNRNSDSFDDFIPTNLHQYVYMILLDPESEFNSCPSTKTLPINAEEINIAI